MATLPAALLQRMRDKSKSIKEKQQGQFGPKAPRYDLSGKNAIVAPGGEILARLLPRWDYANRWVKASTGKFVANSAYEEQEPYFVALQHWYEITTNKGDVIRRPDWCLKLFDADAPCPLCEAAEALLDSADSDERKSGKDLLAKEAFLFNAIIRVKGPAGTPIFKLNEKGQPDIRVMVLSEALLQQYNDIVTGGEAGEEAQHGDVTHTKEGYTLRFQRPKDGKGGRWRLDAAVRPSPLFDPSDAAWKGWSSLLHDIPDIVKQEMRAYDDVYKDFHGEAPESKSEEVKPKASPKVTGSTKPKGEQAPPEDEFAGSASAGTYSTEEPEGGMPEVAAVTEDAGFDLPPDPEEPPKPGRKR
jgi:hypothetical protein